MLSMQNPVFLFVTLKLIAKNVCKPSSTEAEIEAERKTKQKYQCISETVINIRTDICCNNVIKPFYYFVKMLRKCDRGVYIFR